jgi:hypothetical protein
VELQDRQHGVFSSRAVANGVVYVGSHDNNVYAFSLKKEQEQRDPEKPGQLPTAPP